MTQYVGLDVSMEVNRPGIARTVSHCQFVGE
jgi:hypothetical protein